MLNAFVFFDTFETGTKIDSILISRFLSGDEKLRMKSATTVTEIMSRLVKVHGVLRYDVATSSYLFERPIVRDIVYNAMTAAARCELHLKVGDLLASSDKNIFFSVIGMHYMKASGTFTTSDGNGTEINAMVQRKAIYYLSLAADEAMEYGDIDRSVTLLKHVLSCIATVTDVAENVGPVISGLASSVSVAENQTSVISVSASDANGDTLSYSLSGTDAASFSINSSGVITFDAAPNYESKNSYSITVIVIIF